MDENMNNKDFENETEGVAFGSSEYYKKLYDDFPEDVAEMLIGTHPLMKKEVSDELTHSIKIKSAREKNLRAVTENAGPAEERHEEAERVSASKDPVEELSEEEELEDFVGDITSFTKGLVGPSKKQYKDETAEESEPVEDKSEDDITAEQVAKLLGGVDVEPVDDEELDDFEEEYEERPKKKAKREPKKEEKAERPKRKRRQIDEKDLELSNIDKQANLNELFREDDDYYEEKHSGNSVARIVIIIVGIVVLAFFIYKVASLSGQVSKLNDEIETYKTMETEYEQLKLDNLSLTEQVENLQNQLGGGSDENGGDQSGENETTNTSTPASTNSGSTTYTVQNGDTYWGIATKMYGNGSYYTRILTANGLTENDKIREGMTLTIPAA